MWRRGGLIVSALESGSSGPGSNPGWGNCVVFLGKILYSHSASFHPDVQMGTGEFNAGVDHAVDWHSIKGVHKHSLWLHAADTRIRSGLHDGILGSYADFTYLSTYLISAYI